MYTHAPRKLKLHDISVQHRRLTFEPAVAATVKKGGNDDVRSSSSSSSSPGIKVNIELLATPTFVQCESYRSAAHFYTHLHEQMLRFVGSADELAAAMHLPMKGDPPAFPFTVRYCRSAP